jgi:hypothetical protein
MGAVLSILTPVTGLLAWLSALSIAVPVTWRSLPSADSTWVPPPVQLLMPDSASAHPKPTVTSVLFQSLPFGPGERVRLNVGASLSILTVIEPLPGLPSRSPSS